MAEEVTVWEGRPSQLVNTGAFALCGLLSPLVVPIFVGLWKWAQVRFVLYEITSERLRVQTGVLSRTLDEIELYRVKDMRLEQPFWLRLFGLCNLVVHSSDRSDPVMMLRAITDGRNVREKLRKHVERLRGRPAVMEID